mmetsp:Transcript_20776/g.31655  ORF Transcript_20776/g.31655 Transcript_20776/m.31655 type:complete len:80 (-) Transcript_20776:1042-1281(-)|eukprot:scaffold140_cov210-Skeletonema_marinoi.AAC.5
MLLPPASWFVCVKCTRVMSREIYSSNINAIDINNYQQHIKPAYQSTAAAQSFIASPVLTYALPLLLSQIRTFVPSRSRD